jgi:cyclic beta-1,2-glucan synthetase
VGALLAATGLLLAWPISLAVQGGMGLGGLLLFAGLAAIPVSGLAVALVNLLVSRRIGPQPLSKLELRDGVPAESRTLIVIPALLTGDGEVDHLIDQLEVHHLANPDTELGPTPTTRPCPRTMRSSPAPPPGSPA